LKSREHFIIREKIEKLLSHNVSEEVFVAAAVEIFRFQLKYNAVYKAFASHFISNPDDVGSLKQIPFLPVNMWKNHKVFCGEDAAEAIFLSSGTTAQTPSKHFVGSLQLYETSFLKSFTLFYGEPDTYNIFALLPGYHERSDSSLVYMVDKLQKVSLSTLGGFYLRQYEDLKIAIQNSLKSNRKTLLIGVTHALIDFAHHIGKMSAGDMIIMETGGMKGHGPELLREEVHQMLADAFGVRNVHSEYGMTELLSQAYSTGRGVFSCPPWMKVLSREINDPLSYSPYGKRGGINCIDLANVFSCSFIATDDLGIVHQNGTFEISGRFDQSEVRGCNLLV
jgi:hypothetical protein